MWKILAACLVADAATFLVSHRLGAFLLLATALVMFLVGLFRSTG